MEKTYSDALRLNSENIKKSLGVETSVKRLLTKGFEESENEARKLNAIVYGINE